LYPHITVNAVIVTADVRQQKYIAAMAGGTAPAIAYPERQDFVPLVVLNALEPLDTMLKQEKVNLADFYEADIKNSSYQGKVYQLPGYVGTGRSLLWRNKKMFADAGLDPNKPPVTWDEFEAAERKLTLKDGADLKQVGFTGENFKRWLFSTGGKWATDDGRTLTFQNGPAADAVDWAKRRTDAIYGGNAARLAFAAARTAAAQKGGFFTGEVAMTISHQGILFDASQFAKDLLMGVSAAPVMRPEFPPAVAEFFAGYGLSKGTSTPKEALQLIKYVTYDDRGVGWFFRQMLRPSPVKAQNQNPELRKLNSEWDAMLTAMTKDVPIPNTGVDRDVDALVSPLFTDVLNGKQVARQGLTDAAAAAQLKVNAFWASVPTPRK
jgi:multiple sugar transport system substrate-binding protein